MPAPYGNRYAAKPDADRAESQITLRVPRSLKGRAVRCACAVNSKLSPWLILAIAEKCQREEVNNG